MRTIPVEAVQVVGGWGSALAVCLRRAIQHALQAQGEIETSLNSRQLLVKCGKLSLSLNFAFKISPRGPHHTMSALIGVSKTRHNVLSLFSTLFLVLFLSAMIPG